MLRFSVSQWVIFFFAIFFAREALALIIYRFGGEDLPLPPEVGSDGVEFKLLSWADLDPSLGGEAIEVEMEGKVQRPQIGEEVFIPANAGHTVRNVGETNNGWFFGYRNR